ncbi:hypothetical protein TcWFU_000737 [Taenia crassiceps]|uniref:Uncharacterized protein n=1 Tax=Taenia crassiceps TaxID=6207 RepID=A0ABR4QCH4_9CEST
MEAEHNFPLQSKFAPSPHHLRLKPKEENSFEKSETRLRGFQLSLIFCPLLPPSYVHLTYPPAFQLVIFSAFLSPFGAASEMPIRYVYRLRMHYTRTNPA